MKSLIQSLMTDDLTESQHPAIIANIESYPHPPRPGMSSTDHTRFWIIPVKKINYNHSIDFGVAIYDK